MKNTIGLMFLCLMMASTPSMAARHLLDLSVDANRTDNFDGQDTQSDNLTAGIRYSRYQTVGKTSSYSHYAALYLHEQDIANDASYWQASIGGKYAYKLSGGFDATSWVTAITIDRKEYTNKVFDESTIATIQTGLKTQLTDRLTGELVAFHQHNDSVYPEFVALHWESHDDDENGAFVKLTHQAGRYQFRIRQHYAKGTRFVAAPYGTGQIQQRTWPDSTIDTTTLGVNWELSHRNSLDLQTSVYKVSFKSRNYHSNAISLAYLHRFEL